MAESLTVKPLEIYYDKDGEPGQKKPDDEPFDFGEYEPDLGKEIIVYYRNTNHNIIAKMNDLKTNTALISFDIPDEIFPLETVKATIKIKPVPGFMKSGKVDFADIDIVEDHLRALKLLEREINTAKLEGKIDWQEINVTMDRTSRTYGWGR